MPLLPPPLEARLRRSLAGRAVPLVLVGDAGYGKTWMSTTLAQWAREELAGLVQPNGPEPPVCVIEQHITRLGIAGDGALAQRRAPGSAVRHTELIHTVLLSLKSTFELEKEVPSLSRQDQEEVLLGSLAEWASLASERGPTVLVIDGVQHLENYRDALRCGWLPDPPQIRAKPRFPFQIVITAERDSLPFSSVEPRRWSVWEIAPPTPEAAAGIFDEFLGKLQEDFADWADTRELMLRRWQSSASAVRDSPRFIQVLLGELHAGYASIARPDACQRLVATASGGNDVSSLYEAKIHRLAKESGDGPILKRVLAWLWVARAGLTSLELEALISAHFPAAATAAREHIQRVLSSALVGTLQHASGQVSPPVVNRSDLCTLHGSQLREAVAKTCLGQAGVAEADLHYQLATHFLEANQGPQGELLQSSCGYVDLAWHLRQANDRATLWNVITQPRALQHFLEGGAKYEFLQWCRYCRPSNDDTYEAVLGQLLAEIESEPEFAIDVVDRTARLAQEVGCHAQALQLFKRCNLNWNVSEGVAKKARYACEIANLHVRHGVPVHDGASLEETRQEADILLIEALTLMGVEATAKAPIEVSNSAAAANDGASWAYLSSADPEITSVIADVQHVLGLLRFFQENLEQAGWYARAAVAGRRQIGALVAAADSLNLCGSVASKQAAQLQADGQAHSSLPSRLLREAEEYLQESLAIRERLLSNNDPDIAQVLTSLGEFNRQHTKELAKAKSYYKRSHAVYCASLGEKHYRCAYPVEGLARVAYEEGNLREACQLLEQVVEMRMGLPKHASSKELLDNWTQELGADSGVAAEREALVEVNGASASLVAQSRTRSKWGEEEQHLNNATGIFWKRVEELVQERGGVSKISHTEREEMIHTLFKKLDGGCNGAPTPALHLTHSAGSASDLIKVVSDQIEFDTRKVLGLGSVGTKVFRGTFRDAESGRTVAAAVKRVDRAFASTIAREANALRMVSHTHVVTLYSFVDDDTVDCEFAFLALELCTTSLERAVHDDNFNLDPVDLCRQMASGVEHMHVHVKDGHGGGDGIVHLDIHPGNVLLVEEGGVGSKMVAKLSDFGLAQAMVTTSDRVGTMTHTGASGWAAPEIRHATATGGLALPKAADIFSLGCLFYFAMTRGDHPFGDRHQREVNIVKGDAARDLSNRANGFSVRWAHRHLIEWMTRADASSRPDAKQALRHPCMWPSKTHAAYLSGVSVNLNYTFTAELMKIADNRLRGSNWQDLLADVDLPAEVDLKVAAPGCAGLLQTIREMHSLVHPIPWQAVLSQFPWLLISAATLDAKLNKNSTVAVGEMGEFTALGTPVVDAALPNTINELISQISDDPTPTPPRLVQRMDSRQNSEIGFGGTGVVGEEDDPNLIPIEEITFDCRVDGGIGASGAVYRGMWNSTEVAIKTAKGSDPVNLKEVIRNLATEIQRCRKLNHPHITIFLGPCLGRAPHAPDYEQLMLINELLACSLYSQLHKLRKSRAKTLGWLPRVRWAWHICCGMEYLHSKSLIHLDLKSPNILLSVNSIHARAKIADFGNLRTVLETHTRTQTRTVTRIATMDDEFQTVAADDGVPTRPTIAQATSLAITVAEMEKNPAVGEAIGLVHQPYNCLGGLQNVLQKQSETENSNTGVAVSAQHESCNLGTPEWMAPELLQGASYASFKSDIYSFSMVMYELLTGKRPYEGFPGRDAVLRCGPELVTIWASNGTRPVVSATCPQPWSVLMARCWHADSGQRPSFSRVAAELKAIIDSGETRKWDADPTIQLPPGGGGSVIVPAAPRQNRSPPPPPALSKITEEQTSTQTTAAAPSVLLSAPPASLIPSKHTQCDLLPTRCPMPVAPAVARRRAAPLSLANGTETAVPSREPIVSSKDPLGAASSSPTQSTIAFPTESSGSLHAQSTPADDKTETETYDRLPDPELEPEPEKKSRACLVQ